MINQPIEPEQGAPSWPLSPSCWVDKLLDHLEELSSVILPAATGNLSYGEADAETRFKRLDG